MLSRQARYRSPGGSIMTYSPQIQRRGGEQMFRTLAELPEGARSADYISLGVIATTIPPEKVRKILN